MRTEQQTVERIRTPLWHKTRLYPPATTQFPKNMVESVIKALEPIDKLESDNFMPWEKSFTTGEIESLTGNVSETAYEYLKVLETFRTEKSTLLKASERAEKLVEDSIKDATENDDKIDSIIWNDNQRVAITTVLHDSFYPELWREYYMDPEKIKSLPINTQKIIQTIFNHLSWATLSPIREELKPHSNPFTPQLKLHLLGCYTQGFIVDEDGNEVYQITFKAKSESGFYNFKFPADSKE